jgi:hypothetical protein
MKRITVEEAKYYVKLDNPDPYRIRKAVAYTLTPCLDPEYEGWEDTTYYCDPNNIDNEISYMEKILKISEEEIKEHIDYWLGIDWENKSDEQLYAMVESLLRRVGYSIEK